MENNLHNEYNKHIDPILSDRSIWADRIKFTQEYKKLFSRLHLAGYNYQYIANVAQELFKRWGPLYDDFLNTSGFRYDGDDEE